MKKDLNIEEQVCKARKAREEWMRSVGATHTDEVLAMTESQWQRYKAHLQRVLKEPIRIGVYHFGRKTAGGCSVAGTAI